ncbi:MAG: hypothetical protein KKD31_11310, partial [Bacteroidetes bacterium]|nr:hypothetical protein [Bacteroidota bacterium]
FPVSKITKGCISPNYFLLKYILQQVNFSKHTTLPTNPKPAFSFGNAVFNLDDAVHIVGVFLTTPE